MVLVFDVVEDSWLVFDVEEDSWRDPIPLGNDFFVCSVQYEKRLCVIRKTYKEQEMINFGLWKYIME